MKCKFPIKAIDSVDTLGICSWDEKAYKYIIAKPADLKEEADELSQYVFVVRIKIGKHGISFRCQPLLTMAPDKKTKNPTVYIDVKSELLRDTLRTVLRDVRGVSLAEDMPSVCIT